MGFAGSEQGPPARLPSIDPWEVRAEGLHVTWLIPAPNLTEWETEAQAGENIIQGHAQASWVLRQWNR